MIATLSRAGVVVVGARAVGTVTMPPPARAGPTAAVVDRSGARRSRSVGGGMPGWITGAMGRLVRDVVT